jgi:hypothetical protein
MRLSCWHAFFQYNSVQFSHILATLNRGDILKKISVTFTIIVILFIVSIVKRTMMVVSLMLFCTIVLPYRTFKTNPSTPRCGRIEHCCTGRRHASNLVNQCWQIGWLSKSLWKLPHKSYIFSHRIGHSRCYLSR